MRWFFISIIIIIGVILSCNNKSVKTENYMFKDISSSINEQVFHSILDTLEHFETRSQFGYSFYRIVIQQKEYQDIDMKITKLLPSLWHLKKSPPSLFFEIDSTVFFIYSGLEPLIQSDSVFMAKILERYFNKGLINDILPSGKRDPEIYIPENCTWEISITNDKMSNWKKVKDPFRPRFLKQNIILKDTI